MEMAQFVSLTVTLFLINFHSLVTSCPSPCRCTTSRSHKTQIDCSGRGLTEIPRDIGSGVDVSSLDLSRNHIKNITINNVAHLKGLSIIIFDDNEITDIQSFAFKAFQNLKRMSFKRNKLTIIKKDAFNGMSGKLSCSKVNADCHLDITENKIESIESYAFSWITNLSINIGKTSCATIIKPYAFYGSHRISYISIHNIPSLHLEKYWASETDDIRSIAIQHSHIPPLSPYTFEGISNVNFVKFENCSFDKMSTYALSGIKFTPSSSISVYPNDVVVLGLEYPDQYRKKPNQGCGGVLSFIKCDVSNLATDMLRDTNLQYIDIQRSNLRAIDRDVFRGLDCLKRLHISGNIITKGLTDRSFGSIKHAEEVLFENNDVSVIHGNAFAGTQKIGRMTLRLKANNNLTLESHSLSGLIDVYTLHITGVNRDLNRLILQKNAFYGVIDIHNITISNVDIPKLVDHSLYGMKKINALNLVESKLNSISSGAFETFPVQIPIKTLIITGKDTGIICNCNNLVYASDFDNMFEEHSIKCTDSAADQSTGYSGDNFDDSDEKHKISLQLYLSKGCETVGSYSNSVNSINEHRTLIYGSLIVFLCLSYLFR